MNKQERKEFEKDCAILRKKWLNNHYGARASSVRPRKKRKRRTESMDDFWGRLRDG